jgi:hypothetical protein
MYASAQSLNFLDLAKNCSFLNWKLTPVSIIQGLICGWALTNASNLDQYAQLHYLSRAISADLFLDAIREGLIILNL